MDSTGNWKVEQIEELSIILQKKIKSDFDIARGISIIEENRIEVATLKSLDRVSTNSNVLRIGITGSPGVGKSTFINSLLSRLELSRLKVAVIAVDPSSRISQGSILGDRIRITNNRLFEEIYFRSMATRGAYGGLNDAVKSVLHFLAQSGFTVILVETVGVGQNEVEVVECVEKVVLIVDPNAGDEVQMEKSGIMEIGDFFFVNRRDGRDDSLFVRRLKEFVSSSSRLSDELPKVVAGSALSGDGIDEILLDLKLNMSVDNSKKSKFKKVL